MWHSGHLDRPVFSTGHLSYFKVQTGEENQLFYFWTENVGKCLLQIDTYRFFFYLIGDIIVMVLGHKRSELHALEKAVENIRYLLVWIPDD